MDAYSRSVTHIELFAIENNQPALCGRATGFFFKRNDALYLITNWHVVTGVDPTTMIPVEGGPSPEALVFYFKQTVDENGNAMPAPAPGIGNVRKQLDLYKAGSPIWFEHSARQNVDVVAFRLPQSDFPEFAKTMRFAEMR